MEAPRRQFHSGYTELIDSLMSIDLAKRGVVESASADVGEQWFDWSSLHTANEDDISLVRAALEISANVATQRVEFGGRFVSHRHSAHEDYGSNRLHNRIKREIDSVAESSSKPNWDGDGAAAVLSDTIQVAKKLVESFPGMIELPDVSATPHGEVYFDWTPARDRMLVITVGPPPNHEIVFAAMFGSEKMSGHQCWSGSLPRFLECCLHRILIR